MNAQDYAEDLINFVLQHEYYVPVFADHAYEVGEFWYDDARAFLENLAYKYKMPFHQVAGICAAMSIRQHWKRNKYNTEHFIRWYNEYTDEKPRCLSISIAKCKAIMISGHTADDVANILHGRKITAFFWTFMTTPFGKDAYHHPVVIDSWMCKAFRVPNKLNKRMYETLSEAVRIAAYAMRTPVPHFQAYVWTLVRGKGY